MSARSARKIRAGIVLARQVKRKERLGPGWSMVDDVWTLTRKAYWHEMGRMPKVGPKGNATNA